MRSYRAAFMLCVVALGAVAALLFLRNPSDRFAPSLPVLGKVELSWASAIEETGGQTAYRSFADEVQDLPPEKQHELAHSFGAALFSVESLAGLSVCDSRFSFGCFHEFLGRAIATHGLAVVPELNEGCVETLVTSPLSCQHGIGHGVVAALGYDSGSLTRSLEVCEGLPYNDPIGGCYGGAFMEYNLQTMLGSAGRIRPAGVDMLSPCSELPDVYARACYFWQPQWWRQVLYEEGTEVDIIYARIGELCRGAPKQFARDCFEGTGNNLPPDALYDGVRARELCTLVSKDVREQLYCRSLAANSLHVGGAGMKGDGDVVCAGLPEPHLAYCLAYASNESNIAVPGQGEGE